MNSAGICPGYVSVKVHRFRVFRLNNDCTDATQGDPDGGCRVPVPRKEECESTKWRSATKSFIWQPFMLITSYRPSAHRCMFFIVSMLGGRGGVLNGCDMGTNNREFPEQVLLCLFTKRTCCMPVNIGDKMSFMS